METPPQTPTQLNAKLKVVYWIAAAAMIIGVALDAMKRPVDWMSLAGNSALIGVLVLLATAKPEETRSKKLAIYILIAVSIGMLVVRIVRGA